MRDDVELSFCRTPQVPAVTVLTSGLLCAALLAGCSGSDRDANARPSSTTKTSSPAATSSTSSTSPTPSTSATSTTSAPAASGLLIKLRSLSFHLPKGWVVQTSNPASASGFDPKLDGGEASVNVYDQLSFGGETIDSEAKLSLGTATRNKLHPVRKPDLTVNGVKGYVLTGGNKTYAVYHVFGTVTNDHDITVLFQYAERTNDVRATIRSILASITWT